MLKSFRGFVEDIKDETRRASVAASRETYGEDDEREKMHARKALVLIDGAVSYVESRSKIRTKTEEIY